MGEVSAGGDLCEMTGHKFQFYYDLFEPASFQWLKFIWINSKLQSQLGAMLAICEPEVAQTGPIPTGECLQQPNRAHFTSTRYFFTTLNNTICLMI